MSAGAPIRVLIVDDHPMVRSGLVTFLLAYDEFELAGEAANGAEAVALCERVAADVVLMDLVMPEMDGVTATRRISERCPRSRVIVLTSFKEEEQVQAALQAGAIGYLLKNVSADELADAIRAAHVGRPTLAPEATQALVHAVAHPHAPGEELTPREREALQLMVEGLTNREIAQRLVISLSTVKFYVSNILAKLGAQSRTEAVAIALQRRLVT